MSQPSDTETIANGAAAAPYVRLDSQNPAIVSDARDVSILAEEFRNLAFQIEEESRRSERQGLVLAVTSPEPATGKTLLSLNLALTLSRESDSNVLLVETDFRRPSLHTHLQAVPRVQGLWQLLHHDTSLRQAALSVWGEGLKIVLAGAAGKVANVMAQRRAAQVLDEARSAYDLVILDAPPLLLASGRSAAARGDRVLLLVRAGQTRRESIREALSIVGPQKTLGLVLNATRSTPENSYSRYREVSGARVGGYPPSGGGRRDSASADAEEAESAADPPRRARRWRTAAWLPWLLVVLLILGGGLFWYFRLRHAATAGDEPIPMPQATGLASPEGTAGGVATVEPLGSDAVDFGEAPVATTDDPAAGPPRPREETREETPPAAPQSTPETRAGETSAAERPAGRLFEP